MKLSTEGLWMVDKDSKLVSEFQDLWNSSRIIFALTDYLALLRDKYKEFKVTFGDSNGFR